MKGKIKCMVIALLKNWLENYLVMVERLLRIGCSTINIGCSTIKDVHQNTKKRLKRIRIKENEEIYVS